MAKPGKKAKRRLAVVSILFLGVLSFFGVQLYKYWSKILVNRNAEATLNSQYEDLLSNEENLKKQVSKLEDPDYIAKYARDRYLYTKDGETIIQFKE